MSAYDHMTTSSDITSHISADWCKNVSVNDRNQRIRSISKIFKQFQLNVDVSIIQQTELMLLQYSLNLKDYLDDEDFHFRISSVLFRIDKQLYEHFCRRDIVIRNFLQRGKTYENSNTTYRLMSSNILPSMLR